MMVQQGFINLGDYRKLVISITQALSVSASRQKMKPLCQDVAQMCFPQQSEPKHTKAGWKLSSPDLFLKRL